LSDSLSVKSRQPQFPKNPENPIPREIAELAVKTFGGHPFYLQLLGEELMGSGQTPDQSSLKAALQRLLNF